MLESYALAATSGKAQMKKRALDSDESYVLMMWIARKIRTYMMSLVLTLVIISRDSDMIVGCRLDMNTGSFVL